MVIAEGLRPTTQEKVHGEQLPDNIIDSYSQIAAQMALTVSLTTSIGRNGLLPFQRRQVIGRGLLDGGNYSTFQTVNNVVKGEEFMAEYKPGAVAAIAIARGNGFMSMPKKFEYMNVLVGPPQADEEILSSARDKQDGLRRRLIGISVNPFVAAREEKTGIKIDPVSGLMSIIRAATKATNKKDGPYGDLIVAGQIHSTEALIAAAAVKALGGFMEVKKSDNSLLSLENLIPGEKQELAVCIGLITDDHYFGKPGVIRGGNGSYFVTTAIIANEEINFKSINIKIPGTVTRHF